MIGVNYAGPLQHCISRQGERKAYVLLVLQCYVGGLLGYLAKFGNRRVLEEFEKVHWEARETRANLFWQWQDICWCCEVGQGIVMYCSLY